MVIRRYSSNDFGGGGLPAMDISLRLSVFASLRYLLSLITILNDRDRGLSPLALRGAPVFGLVGGTSALTG